MLPKLPNWKKYVRRMKEAPDFGIHGTPHKNLDKILTGISERRGVWGHYFGVNKEDRELFDKVFYQHLCASVSAAIGYSVPYSIKNGEMEIESLPCIILGICKEKENGYVRHDAHARSGIYGDTFYVGHDMNFLFNFYPLVIQKSELEKINIKAARKEWNTPDNCWRNFSAGHYIMDALTSNMIKKMNVVFSQP